jgi:hypothetical protein
MAAEAVKKIYTSTGDSLDAWPIGELMWAQQHNRNVMNVTEENISVRYEP